MFRKPDYIPFGLGIFILGGFILVPLIWSRFNHMDFGDAVFPSILSCLVFFIAHDNKGNFSFIRFIAGLALVYFYAIRAATQYGGSLKPIFFAGGLLGYIVMFACGWAGIMLGRLIRGKETVEEERLAQKKQADELVQKITQEEQKQNTDLTPGAELVAAQLSAFHRFIAESYLAWKSGRMDSLSELFRQEALQNNFEKFVKAHEKYRKLIDTCNEIRAFRPGEYLVSLTENLFLMTSEVIYVLKPAPRLIRIREISGYKLSGVLTVTMDVTLISGEKIVIGKMKAAPAEKFVFSFRDGKIPASPRP